MYVKDIIFYNRAPFETLHLSFEESSITVLTAVNGKGKTTILSYIMDAWVEMTRSAFSQSYKNKEDDYYRISAGFHLIDIHIPSFVYLRFVHNGKPYDYLDYRNGLPRELYEEQVKLEDKINYDDISAKIQKNPSAKIVDGRIDKDIITGVFNSQVMTYMPSYRNEIPNYLTDAYKTKWEHDVSMQFSMKLRNPLEVNEGFPKLANWLLDLLLDLVLTEYATKKSAPEFVVWNNMNTILRKALISKHPDEDVRFAVGGRGSGAERISIYKNSANVQLYPSIFGLSTGEQSMIMMFGEILRQADHLHNNIALEAIEGIVLIDEIDKNLHLRLQKEELPVLMQLFPKVQFIVTSHSPFLNMGLADKAPDRTVVVDLDNGGVMTTPTNNEVYQDTYEMFLNERNHFAEEYERVNGMLKQLVRPVVITEGKTDIKHILKAMKMLGIERQFDVINEAEQPEGEGTLLGIVKNLCKVPQPRKIIAVFDRDTNATKDIGNPYKDYGNNVYALRIRCPQDRIDNGRTAISIEYLYSDDEIHMVLPNGCQLFFGNEFKTDSTRRNIANSELRLALPDGCGKDKIVENNGGQAVYDNNDNNHLATKDDFANAVVNGDIAISPQSWENFRPTIDIINQIIAL